MYNPDINDLSVEHLDENGDLRRMPLGHLSDGCCAALSMFVGIACSMALLNPDPL